MHGLVKHIADGAKVDRCVNWMIGGERRWYDRCEVGGRGCAGQAADAITK